MRMSTDPNYRKTYENQSHAWSSSSNSQQHQEYREENKEISNEIFLDFIHQTYSACEEDEHGNKRQPSEPDDKNVYLTPPSVPNEVPMHSYGPNVNDRNASDVNVITPSLSMIQRKRPKIDVPSSQREANKRANNLDHYDPNPVVCQQPIGSSYSRRDFNPPSHASHSSSSTYNYSQQSMGPPPLESSRQHFNTSYPPSYPPQYSQHAYYPPPPPSYQSYYPSQQYYPYPPPPYYPSQPPQYYQPPILTVTETDVLCGRGGATNSHSGNKYFRSLVKQHQINYIKAKKKDKPAVADNIVKIIKDKGGRFLTKDKNTGTWLNIGNFRAREKTSQALREGAPELKKIHGGCFDDKDDKDDSSKKDDDVAKV